MLDEERRRRNLKSMMANVLPDKIVKLIRLIRDDSGYVEWTPTYNQDHIVTCNNCDFMNDEKFLQSYKLGKSTQSWGSAEIHWRAYVVCWAANRARSLPGDFVECGVNKGGYALALMDYINFKKLGKKFYLLDTYEGLCEKYVTEEERKYGILERYKYQTCYDEVKDTFKGYPNVEIIKGTVPDTLSLVKTDKVCFLSIDMNCAIPEVAAAEFFWDKLVSGSVIVLDDYGGWGHIVQKKAFDKFSEERGVQVLSLPTGQGLIFKP